MPDDQLFIVGLQEHCRNKLEMMGCHHIYAKNQHEFIFCTGVCNAAKTDFFIRNLERQATG